MWRRTVRLRGAIALALALVGGNLFVAADAPSKTSTLPPLTRQGDPVLHQSTAYAIFWQPGSTVMSDSYKTEIENFFSDVAADSGKPGNFYSVATQYWDTHGAITYQATFNKNTNVYQDSDPYPKLGGCTGSKAPTCLSDSNLLREVKTVIARKGWPASSESKTGAVYFLFLPQNVDYCAPNYTTAKCGQHWPHEVCDGTLTGCASSGTCGFHAFYSNGGSRVAFAVLSYGNSTAFKCLVSQSKPSPSDADYTVSTISHEWMESLTNPFSSDVGTSSWYSIGNGEIGDLCEFEGTSAETINGHSYWLQPEYSDLGGSPDSCVASFTPSRTLNLSPATGPAGSPVTVTANGLDPQEPLILLVDNKQVATFPSVDTHGNSTLSTNIPSLASGSHTLTAKGEHSGVSASATFNVTTVSPSYYSGHIVQWDGDAKKPKTAWYVTPDLKRHWIYDAATYACLKNQGAPGPDVLSSTILNQLPDVTGSWATCGGVAFEGSIIRQSGGSNWVVLNGERHLEPDWATDLCARYVQGRRVSFTGVDATSIASIPLGSPYQCSIENSILTAEDQPNPKPSYAFYSGRRHWIPDAWTYRYLQEKSGFTTVLDIAKLSEINLLPDGGPQTAELNPADIPVNSIVRRDDGISWVVDSSRIRHHIPYAQDDVCWRDLKAYPVSATGLTYNEANEVGQEAAAWPCIIGNRVVRSDDGSSWFVDTTNTRHKIPDTSTYYWYVHRYPVTSTQWPHADVNEIPKGSDEPHELDPTLTVVMEGGGDGTVGGGGINCGGGTCSTYYMNLSTTVTLSQAADNISGFWSWSGDCSGIDGSCTVTMNQDRTVYATFVPTWRIQSNYNHLFVSAERDYPSPDTGLLRARNGSVGTWEKYWIQGNCASSCAFISLANHEYVSARFDMGGNSKGELRAMASGWNGAWESFRVTSNGIWSIGGNCYVTGEMLDQGKYYARLRARGAASVSGWESFNVARG